VSGVTSREQTRLRSGKSDTLSDLLSSHGQDLSDFVTTAIGRRPYSSTNASGFRDSRRQTAMQGSIGIMFLAAVIAIVLVAGTSTLPLVGGVCAVAAVAVTIDQRRSRPSR
jgi:hypothetical protein